LRDQEQEQSTHKKYRSDFSLAVARRNLWARSANNSWRTRREVAERSRPFVNFNYVAAPMRNKTSAICLSMAIAAVFVAVLARLPSHSDRRVTREQFEQLEAGMTRAEAESLIGGPPRNDLKYPAIIWLPQATGTPISREIAAPSPTVDFLVREDKPKTPRPAARIASTLDFFPQVTTKDGNQVVWIGRSELIAVYFGPDGRLQHKYCSTVHETVAPSAIDWIASRPRMIRRSLGF
jgi:hypothetical protein